MAKFTMESRKGADFNQQDIFDDAPFGTADPLTLRSYSKGTRDYPRFMESSSLGRGVVHPMGLGNVLNHPMMNGIFDDIIAKVESVLPSTEQITDAVVSAGQQAVSSAAGTLAQQTLAKPTVQTAIAETAKTQAVQATASQINKFSAWVTANKKMILIGSGAVVAGYIALKMLKKKR